MREILFRGRDKHGTWHYGDLVRKFDVTYIVQFNKYVNFLRHEYVEVVPETVGQYTGIDRERRKLYEGDIITALAARIRVRGSDNNPSKHDEHRTEFRGVVRMVAGSWMLDFRNIPFNNAKLAMKGRESVGRIMGNVGWGSAFRYDWNVYYLDEAIIDWQQGRHKQDIRPIGNIHDNPELLEELQ